MSLEKPALVANPKTHAHFRFNRVDPTESTNLRRSFKDEYHRKLNDVIDNVEDWFDEIEELNYSRLRYRFEEWFEQTLFDTVIGRITDSKLHNGDHWTGSHVRTAYQHGLRMAKRDLAQTDLTEYQKRQATKFYSEEHADAVELEYEAAYMGLRDQLHRLIDSMGEVVREGIESRYDVDTFANETTQLIETQAKNYASAHANTIVVETINEALLTTYQKAGVTSVGVAGEGTGSGSGRENAIAVPKHWLRTNIPDPETFAEAVGISEAEADALPDADDPTTPDDVQWATAGDDNVCEACQSLEGSILAIGDVEDNPHLKPPIHPNCRCRLIPLMTGTDDGEESEVVTVETRSTDSEISDDELLELEAVETDVDPSEIGDSVELEHGDQVDIELEGGGSHENMVVTKNTDGHPSFRLEPENQVDFDQSSRGISFGGGEFQTGVDEITSMKRRRTTLQGYPDEVGRAIGGYHEPKRNALVTKLTKYQDEIGDDLGLLTFDDTDFDAAGVYGIARYRGHDDRQDDFALFFPRVDKSDKISSDFADGWIAQRDFGDVVEHEIGHIRHYQRMRAEHGGFVTYGDITTPAELALESDVSRYAATNVRESVAEMHLLMATGRTDQIRDDLLSWYDKIEAVPPRPD